MIAPFHPSIADPILGEAGQRERLAEAIHGPLFVADLLLNRGIKDKETARAFFLALPPEPDATKPDAPMLGLETALDALVQAHAAGQRIVIHGDYDVDGVTATALLYLGLRSMGFPCGWFIPNRFADGYGITRGSIDKIRAETTHIIISVDTGIAACEEVAYAKSQGIDVIITDHHQAGPEIPQALAILNPNQPGCPYPNKGLSGVGVAYTLLCALSERLPGCQPEDYLDLVALGSLADNVPVTGANRAIIRNGLRRISQTRSPGVHALFHKTGVAADSLSTMDVLFKITPLLNAMGRMGSPEISLRLLISADSIEAERHLASMVEQNNLRRQIDQAITEEAIHRIENDPSLRHAACLVVGDATWHEGVIGIVAARLVEKYGRPAFVLAIDKEGRAKGSGRTVTGFHLHRAIGTVPHLFEKWGGHYYACGFTLKAECGDTFRQAMEALATTYLGEATGPAPVQPAAWMPLGELDESSMTWLRRFEPFGPLNESPLFCAEDVDLHDKPRIVGEKHLKFSVAQNGGVFDAIAFNMGHRAAAMEGLKSLKRIAFHPEWNIFRGRRRIQLRVVAFECYG